MKLTVKERLILLQCLPSTGDLTTLRIVRETQDTLSFSEAEHMKLKFTTEGENSTARLRWDASADEPIEIEIGYKAFELICEQFDKLDKDKKLTLELLPIYEKLLAAKTNRV